MAHLSKSELLILLADERTHEQAVRYILSHPGIRLPKAAIFRNQEERDSWNSFAAEHSCAKYTDKNHCRNIRRKLDAESTDPTAVIELLFDAPLRVVRDTLARLPIPAGLQFTELSHRVFYLSCLVQQRRRPADEFLLLRTVEAAWKEKPAEQLKRTVLPKIFVNLSNESISKYIKSNVMDPRGAFLFLEFIVVKLDRHLIHLWFSDRLPLMCSLLSRLDRMQILPTTPFDLGTFESLLRFRCFRRHIFNYWKNEQFLLKMQPFCCRDDYTFYYRLQNPEYSPSLAVRPSDSSLFSFFTVSKLSAERIEQVSQYLRRYGYTVILNLYFQKHLDEFLLLAEDTPPFRLITQSLIDFNNRHNDASSSLPIMKITENLNSRLWRGLQHKTSLFKATAKYFAEPAEDPVLHGLLSGNYNFQPVEAEKYVKTVYEDELRPYFLTRPIQEMVPLINNWNIRFFLSVLSTKLLLRPPSAVPGECADSLSGLPADDLLLIVETALTTPPEELSTAAQLLDRLFTVQSPQLYARLARPLRFLYTVRQPVFTADFLSCLRQTQLFGLWEARELYFFTRDEQLPLCADSSMLDTLFRLSFVADDICRFYFVECFAELSAQLDSSLSREDAARLIRLEEQCRTREPLGCGPDRILYHLKLLSGLLPDIGSEASDDQNTFLIRIGYTLHSNLSDRHSLFILFDPICRILHGPNTPTKTLLLLFLDPSILTKQCTLRFVNTLIPLLNNTNLTVCHLSKALLNRVSIENKEIQSIFPLIVQAFIDRESFLLFLESFQSILFANYLCFNSLSILLELLFQYLSEYRAEILPILSKLQHIIKEKDLSAAAPLIVRQMNTLVLRNSVIAQEAVRVSKTYCMYADYESFGTLFPHLPDLRVSLYMVDILKERASAPLNTRVIRDVMDCYGTPPSAFIAAACELPEFLDYFRSFLPVLRALFCGQSQSDRSIALGAFGAVLRADIEEPVRTEILLFVLECVVYESHQVRLAALDLLAYQPAILFILRHDPHPVVRRKAQDIWKAGNNNPYRLMKDIHGDIIGYVHFMGSAVFRESLIDAVVELLTKHTAHIESYVSHATEAETESSGPLEMADGCLVSSSTVSIHRRLLLSVEGPLATARQVKEFVLTEALQLGKLERLAMAFCVRTCSPVIFDLLYQRDGCRCTLLADIPKECLYSLCTDNKQLAYHLFMTFKDLQLLGKLTNTQKLSILTEMLSSNSEAVRDATTEAVIRSLESSREAEEVMALAPPAVCAVYIRDDRTDCGLLLKLFMRVFDGLKGVDEFLELKNLKHIMHCVHYNVRDKRRLFSLLIEDDARRCFEQAANLVSVVEFDGELAHRAAAYFLRSYLNDSREVLAGYALKELYDKQVDLGFFKTIMETTVL